MEPRPIHYVIRACAAELVAGDPDKPVEGVCTDSRRVRAGDVFFALAGERFDGHAYAAEAARKGAVAVVVRGDRVRALSGLPDPVAVLAVADTRRALGALGARYREEFRPGVIAVGGSNGKTTTKELLASVLRRRFDTLWNEASFNNEIGVPLTLLRLTAGHRMAVLELGTNHPGELAPLMRLAQPRDGILTNIGREHLEYFGDLAGVAGEEAALAEGLPPFGRLFLNGDDPWTPWIAPRSPARVVTVGFNPHNDWRARVIGAGMEGVRFEVHAPQPAYSGDYSIQLLGRHQVANALLALAAAAEWGVAPDAAREGLAACAPVRHRMEAVDCGGHRVLNDAYNANADSMLAALQTLCDFPCAGRRWAVLGDMAELGVHTASAHREVGRRAAELRVDRLVTIGAWAQTTAEAARAAGLADTVVCDGLAAAAEAVRGRVGPGDVVLIKGSRAAGLERLAEALDTCSPASGMGGCT
ncbi:MAG: UDP-N-acetylmuramoyl-tripeptide--D-alanyl-D-alanine ligase [Verrucomicrobia bacterium]|nr:UDP-N-acetylmuramoyl-tripeptide--D-alanyl-D-alanine ligase [Verrucomicrobiota bacterium]